LVIDPDDSEGSGFDYPILDRLDVMVGHGAMIEVSTPENGMDPKVVATTQ
jgi:hypothetical protein